MKFLPVIKAAFAVSVAGVALATVQAADEPLKAEVKDEPVYANEFDCYISNNFPHEVLGLTYNDTGEVVYDMSSDAARDYPCLKYIL